MRTLLRERELKRTVRGRDSGGIVPFKVVGLPVVQVHGFPIRVIIGIECAPIYIELVGKDESILRLTVGERGTGIGPFRRVGVDQRREARDIGDL